MNTFVFLGPSVDVDTAAQICNAQFLPPAKMGDIYRLCERPGTTVIALIDGLFERTPAIWHKEILYALSLGIRVYGGASMGALRAAELHTFGMQGVGRIFQGYADGELEDDDEVALVHGPAETGFASQSEALVNIRFGLAGAQTAHAISAQTARQCMQLIGKVFYPERSWPALYELARTASLPEDEMTALKRYVEEHRPNQKRLDALATLHEVARYAREGVRTAAPTFHFEATSAWEAMRMDCQMAGTSAASVRFGLLRNHARLFSTVELPLRDLALLMDLVEAEAARRQLATPDIPALIDQFFVRRHVTGMASRQAWCTANDVDNGALAELARVDFFLQETKVRQAPRLGRRMLDALRLTGHYEATRDEVEAKWQVLDEHQARSLRQSDIGTSDEVAAWYAARTGIATAVAATQAGFDTQREFLDELNFEYFYTQLSNTHHNINQR